MKSTLEPLPYDGACSVRAMLEGLRDEFGWSPVCEGGNIIGLERAGAHVSLEPGGQLELSGAQLRTIHETCDEANTHLDEVRAVADRIGAGFIGLGASPDWNHAQMPVMPKGRYRLMTEYMDRVGSLGTQMMYRTCTIQVNLDFSSEIRHGPQTPGCPGTAAGRHGTVRQFGSIRRQAVRAPELAVPGLA